MYFYCCTEDVKCARAQRDFLLFRSFRGPGLPSMLCWLLDIPGISPSLPQSPDLSKRTVGQPRVTCPCASPIVHLGQAGRRAQPGQWRPREAHRAGFPPGKLRQWSEEWHPPNSSQTPSASVGPMQATQAARLRAEDPAQRCQGRGRAEDPRLEGRSEHSIRSRSRRGRQWRWRTPVQSQC